MSFPETRATLIRRLAADRKAAGWAEFHRDYWRPICRFVRWNGGLTEADAEDVAAEVFETLVKTELLARWVDSRTAKLRTLLCSVTRNILSNRRRVGEGRARLIRDHGGALDRYRELETLPPDDAAAIDGVFYAAWACELLKSAVEELLAELQAAGRGDCFRVLYGRICEEMTIGEVGASLNLTPATVDNYFRSSRDRLSRKLRELLQRHIARYSDAADLAAELDEEWRRLGDYLTRNGGLEESMRRVSLGLDATLRASVGDGLTVGGSGAERE
jgi:DNA-directed RNA polymerase specialized sigma24 family protein